jgi:integrase
MRRGEMLALRFCDIDAIRQVFVLRGTTTKSKKTRLVPISTARLKAVWSSSNSTALARRSQTVRRCSAIPQASLSASSEQRGRWL